MNFIFRALCVSSVFLFSAVQAFSTAPNAGAAGDNEFVGQFDTTLAVNKEDTETVIFKATSRDALRENKAFTPTAHITSNRLQTPNDAPALAAVLIEEEDEKPLLFVDLNADNVFGDDEKFVFRRRKSDDPNVLETTVNLPVKEGFFTVCPIYVQYLRNYRTAKMTESDRLIEQSTTVYARGAVDVKGQKIPVQYVYSFGDKKVTPERGWLGIDADGDGEIDMDNLSPEAARADSETVVFRVGQTYLSTKKADIAKNQIVLRENSAKDYKRTELGVGKEIADFSFVDLNGKKHKLSEFRGKYVLLDFWGLWCGPCRDELPYLRESYKRFQTRGLEIVGMNTDVEYTPESVKKFLTDNGISWTQARQDSFTELKDFQFRIESFPTTFLIAPDGKILSMSREERGEPNLRGRNLLETLDKILPEK